MTTAIHYSSVQLSPGSREVFGLQVAITQLLKNYFQYSQQETFSILVGSVADWEEIQQVAAEARIDPTRLAGLDRRYPRENFAAFSTIFRADPHTVKLLWQRQMVARPGFSLCTLAHAISGVETGEVLEQYCLAPSDASDAIICPSRAVKSAISSFWDLYGDYMEQRFGKKFVCAVQLPVIPLGIDVAQYEAKASPDKRHSQRQELGIGDDDIVLLWVGRLSYAIKAHPLSMYQAAERAAEMSGKKIHLVMVGYFMPEESEPHFRALATDICSKATVSFIARNDPRFPDGLWAAGDIFLSLIDNMQESFGLTPLEAMAAGLPRVISDWDGYRDSVTDGEDGFLVPTYQPPPGQGRVLSELVTAGREFYGGFLGKSAMSVAVDIPKAAAAIARLATDKNMRELMAKKARQRVKGYDWRNLIPRYEALWSELAAQRRSASTFSTEWVSALPHAPDPFSMYAAYPTASLRDTDRLTVTASTAEIKKLWSHEINVFAFDIMLSPDQTTQIINYIGKAPGTTIGQMRRDFHAYDPAALWRALGWLVKLGILGIEPVNL